MMIPISSGSGSAGGSLLAEVTVDVFYAMLERQEAPIVLHREAGWPTQHTYVTRWQGMLFFFKNRSPTDFSTRADVIEVENIYQSWSQVG